MGNRIDLQYILENILGSESVYFQPPEGYKIEPYPAIVYKRMRIINTHADDSVYRQLIKYKITVMDKDPESEIVEKVSLLPMCEHVDNFVVSGLYHDVFNIFY